MKKFIVFLLIIVVAYKLYSHKEMRDIEIRADYIISLMEKHYRNEGYYPNRIEKILDVELVNKYMMYNSNKIPGKGYFIILYNSADRNEYGDILVVGGYNPPNVIYFPKIKKKEINSDYFND
ncbi:hypothetical protein [Bibersteinia trehalosi]|uniref:hypothetical protein n=1 Tax=Bibersteinia trehalosi TaxID=47735 RepID=UPI00046D4033|nr:hypothetical protein [Bibersteinia trehalosi]